MFDIFCTHMYPHAAPMFALATTGGGSFRFNPNLYVLAHPCTQHANQLTHFVPCSPCSRCFRFSYANGKVGLSFFPRK